MLRGRLLLRILPLAAALAILPLLLQGPSCGHDFDFHLLNWFEAAAQFRHGNLHPLWAVSPAFNAGEPRFLFYPPLSWTLGALLGLVLPWTWTPIAYTGIALTASGLAMHRLARAHAGPAASLLAATLYLANPYMLFTAYERTAYAELLAAAWLPLLIHAILKPRPTIPAIAIPLALLWLTNAPAAVMGTYTLALLTLIRLLLPSHTTTTRVPHLRRLHRLRWVPQLPADHASPATPRVPHLRRLHRLRWAPPNPPGRTNLALTTLAGTTLGLALVAFYILPAATERPFVQIAMAISPGMRIEDNTLFHHTGLTEDALAHDAVLDTASLIALLLLTATTLALVTSRLRKNRATPSEGVPSPTVNAAAEGPTVPLHIPLIALTATLAFLLTPLSLPLWHHLPELAFLQFPWRLLAVLATAFGLAAALALDRLPLDRTAWLLTLPVAAALTLPAAHLFRQPCEASDTVSARLTRFQANAGSEPTDEYTPAEADNDALKPNSPPYWLAQDPDAPPPQNAPPGPAPRDLDLTSLNPGYLILNLRAYPGWRPLLNNQEIPPAAPRADGLLTLQVPAGPLHLHLAFRQPPREQAAYAVSLIALLILGILILRERPRLTNIPRKHPTTPRT